MVQRRIISLTREGWTRIPAEFRKKFGFGRRALIFETEDGVLFKPLPSIEDERGSIRHLFDGRSAREILEEARAEDNKGMGY